MIYRELGKTGLRVSEIGLGCEGFAEHDGVYLVPLLDAAEAAGVNLIDLYTPDPQMRSGLGRALRGRREHFILQGHLCTIWRDGQYKRTRDFREVQEGFEDLFNRLETDYIDIGMIHYVDTMEDWETVIHGPILPYARKLKEEGKIRHIGLSSHNPVVSLEAVRSGLIEVLMFSVNPCYDLMPPTDTCAELFDPRNYDKSFLNMDPNRAALYELCSERGIGITVMKAFGGGDLLNAELSPAGKALTVSQCIHYALTRPGVVSVLSGAQTPEELAASIAYETASDEERDYASALASFPRISWKGHCMYCGHCAPCPMGIDVASVTKFLNLARAQGRVPETVREHYGLLAHGGGECIGCGACESRCPFEVPVIENMACAAELFGR